MGNAYSAVGSQTYWGYSASSATNGPSAPESCNEGESLLLLCAIDLSRALIITWGPTSMLASQGALWSFRSWGPRDTRGPQFPPSASLHGRNSPCSIPAWWTSGAHCHWDPARARPVPPALKCASSAPHLFPRAFPGLILLCSHTEKARR